MPASTLGAPQQRSGGSAPAAPAALVPFVRASRQHEEPFIDLTNTLGASTIAVSPQDIPAYGYLRSVLILVEGTTTSNAAAVTFAADGPFNVLSDFALTDVNGQPIVGPFSGYELMLINKYGGYARRHDPRIVEFLATTGSGGSGGSFRFLLRVPVEINPATGFGALANMNAAATYKLRFTLNTSAAPYGTAPTNPPSVRVRCWQEAWAQPAQTNLRGQQQATSPPASGTTQYWSLASYALSAGTTRVQLSRVGNLVRNLILVFRDNSNVRQDANFPDPLQFYWDSRLIFNRGMRVNKGFAAERYDLQVADGTFDQALALDAGVMPIDFTSGDDGSAGFESGNLYIPTVQSSRLEFLGTFSAGTLQVLTNDIAPLPGAGY
ncbi:MAG TPA: hypothetical protein VFC99_05740 [Acidimicrobiia bacterium]|nr:hypothetical protein [Acidimicrobiia bacterium]